MRHLLTSLAVLAATLVMIGCATTLGAASALGALNAAGMTMDAYCALTPEARAEFRRKLDLRVPIIQCDPAAP